MKLFFNFFFYLYCLIYDFFNLIFSKLDFNRNILNNFEQSYHNYYLNFWFKNTFYVLLKNNFYVLDIIFYKLYSFKYLKEHDFIKVYRNFFRLIHIKKGFYVSNYDDFKKLNFLRFKKLNFFSGYIYFYRYFKFIILLLLVFFYIYISLLFRLLPFNKLFFSWVCVIMFCYWLISGFVFFIKKYQFGKYTSAIQRFWRRSYILFWLIEGSTFSVFLYLTFNSSQESYYMFDNISFFKNHLFSWSFFLFKLILVVILLLFTYYLLISLKWNLFNKINLYLLIITILLTFITWSEFYQFYHILNFYGNLNWIYDLDEHFWSLEYDVTRSRIGNHYLMILFILKFWHIVFIYGFWIFFILRGIELNKVRYSLLSANLQNFVILYIFSWVFMYPWFKFFFRFILSNPYYWFYINNKRIIFRIFFNDIKLYYLSILDSFFFLRSFYKFEYSFFYFKEVTFSNNFESCRKNIIKNIVLKRLV